jgi:hypothetical protein
MAVGKPWHSVVVLENYRMGQLLPICDQLRIVVHALLARAVAQLQAQVALDGGCLDLDYCARHVAP